MPTSLAQEQMADPEDGAILGTLLGKLGIKAQLLHALHQYERLRRPRREAIAKESINQKHIFHLPDSLEQQNRDQILMRYLGNDVDGPFPCRW